MCHYCIVSTASVLEERGNFSPQLRFRCKDVYMSQLIDEAIRRPNICHNPRNVLWHCPRPGTGR